MKKPKKISDKKPKKQQKIEGALSQPKLKNQNVRDFSRCPRCGAQTRTSKSFTGADSEFWRECVKCNTYINTYIPQFHQQCVHSDSHRYVGNFGGYGTGKTTTSREEVYKHVFLTPSGNTLIGANVQSQYEQTIKRELEADIPRDFVQDYSSQKQYMDLVNGHRIMYRPFDDPNKLRSYNLSMFLIVEGSEVKKESFTQLKTRLRNTAATTFKVKNGEIVYEKADNGVLIPVIEHDWRKGIIESNPDGGWIRSDVLLYSDIINKYGTINDTYAVSEAERDSNISSHVAATEVNKFLPKTFISELVKNKPLWWVNRYVYGSFLYAEGMVYPAAQNCIVSTYDVPKDWRRIVAYDYGLSDDSVFLFGAVNEAKNKLVIYKEVRFNNRNVEQIAEIFKKNITDILPGNWICQPIIDPKSGVKRDYEKKSLIDHFLDYDIVFMPGQINLDARIFRLNTYIESGRLEIMDCCTGLIKELKEYKFKAKNFDEAGWDNKPEDKNNHGINPLEWIVMELPADPNQLVYGIYNRYGEDVSKPKQLLDETAVWALDLDDEQEQQHLETPFEISYYY